MHSALVAKNLAFVGGLYCRLYAEAPDGWAADNLEGDWCAGLRFFFDHAFMQNRPVETSERLRNLTVQTLERQLFADRDSEEAYQFLQQTARRDRFDSLLPPEEAQATDGYKSNAQLNNKRDRQMVRGALAYVAHSPNQRNIYEVIISQLRAAGDHLERLRSTDRFLRTFHGVGDKIAPFIIQDVSLLNRQTNLIPPNLSADAYRFAFPVDTLIRQIAPHLGYEGMQDEDDRIKDYFIDLSLKNGLYPPLCAAALWYLAYHSTEILVEHCIKTATLS